MSEVQVRNLHSSPHSWREGPPSRTRARTAADAGGLCAALSRAGRLRQGSRTVAESWECEVLLTASRFHCCFAQFCMPVRCGQFATQTLHWYLHVVAGANQCGMTAKTKRAARQQCSRTLTGSSSRRRIGHASPTQRLRRSGLKRKPRLPGLSDAASAPGGLLWLCCPLL